LGDNDLDSFFGYTNHSQKNNFDRFCFGYGPTANGYENYEHANGIIDDIRIYNRELSEDEIASLYYEGASGTSTRDLEESGSITGTEVVGSPDAQVYIYQNQLYVNSPESEQITVYSLGGSVLYQSLKAAGTASFDIGSLPRGVLIVRGSSGWAKKTVKQ
jgi:hypothetical protein